MDASDSGSVTKRGSVMRRVIHSFMMAAITVMLALLGSASADARGQIQPSKVLFEGFVRATGGREMYARIDRPTKGQVKGWIYLQHGLMDNSAKWDPIARILLEKGYGVIRIDLHGHGQTLLRAMEKGEPVPATWDASVLAHDLATVLGSLEKKYKIEKPSIVGHSLGGGLTIAMASVPEYANLFGDVMLPIAPYVFRMDWRQIEKIADLNPVTSFWVRSIQQALPDSVRSVVEAVTTDPAMDLAMTKAYGEHGWREVNEDHPEWTEEQRAKWVEESVKSAIAVTKGIRSLDNRNLAGEIDPRFRFTMIAGGKDELLDLPLERELFDRIGKGEDDRLLVVNDAGHFITRQAPELVAKVIVGSVEGKKLKERVTRINAGLKQADDGKDHLLLGKRQGIDQYERDETLPASQRNSSVHSSRNAVGARCESVFAGGR